MRGIVNIFLVVGIFGLFRAHALPTVVPVPSTKVASSAPAPFIPSVAPSAVPLPFPSTLPLAVPTPARRFDNVARVEPDDTPPDGYGSSPGRFTLKKTKTPNPAT